MTTETASLPASSTPLEQQTYERIVTVAAALGHILCHMGMTIFPGVMLAVSGEFGLLKDQVTFLALAGYMLMGFGALPVGIWVDKKGPIKVMAIYFFLMMASGLLLACTSSTLHLFIGLTLLGLAASIYHPAGLALISLHIRDRGRALGINGVAGNFGIAGGPAIGMLAASLGVWRMAYAVLAIVAFLSSLLMLRLLRHPMPAEEVAHTPTPGTVSGPSENRSWKRFLPIALLLGAMTLAGFNYRSLITGLPVYVNGGTELPKGIDKYTNSAFLFLVVLIGGFGQYFGGWAVTRFGGRVYAYLLALMAPLAILLVFMEAHPARILVVGVLAVFLFAQQPVENLLLAEWTSKSRRGVSYGTKFALTFGLGALGAPYIGVILRANQSVAPAFYGIAASACLMILLIFLALRARARAMQVSTTSTATEPSNSR